MAAERKVELKDVGLDIGLSIAKHFYKTEYLHYGYWEEGLSVEPANVLQAQDNYADLILSHIPEGTKTILDVGCGSGKFATKLLDAGYEVDCVSPSPFLSDYARGLFGDRAHIFECRYEALQTHKTYDLILFSESFQYLPLKEALHNTLLLLNKEGHMLICDFFKKEVEGKSPISGGHRINRFYSVMEQYPFALLTDLEITKRTAPSLDIMNGLIVEVIHPIWNSVAYYMGSNYPNFTKLFSLALQKKIAQAHRKYFSGQTKGESFAKFKTYHLFVYQKETPS